MESCARFSESIDCQTIRGTNPTADRQRFLGPSGCVLRDLRIDRRCEECKQRFHPGRRREFPFISRAKSPSRSPPKTTSVHYCESSTQPRGTS